MDKQYFIELTNRLYRLTLLFPEKEALRHKIRGVADEILVNLVVILEGEPKDRRESAFNVERNIEILDVLFELAKKQDWVLSREIGEIQDEYFEIKKEVEEFNNITRREARDVQKKSFPATEEKIASAEENPVADIPLSKRQQRILQLMKERDQLQVKDIQEIFPKLTKRTLRRDLNILLEKGVIKRVGKGNGTYYTAKQKASVIGHR